MVVVSLAAKNTLGYISIRVVRNPGLSSSMQVWPNETCAGARLS